MIKLSDYVIQFIAEQGVKHVFLLPGGGCMHLVDSLGRNGQMEYVCNLHEQACAIAADAYAQYTGNLGVALVTTGPGGTNALTGVAAAYLDSTPCLFLSGQVKRSDMKTGRGVRQMGFQEIDIVAMAAPITKYAKTIIDPQTIGYELEKAVHLARSGRPGPVWLDLPLDIQAAQIEETTLPRFQPEPTMPSQEELAAQVRRTLALLAPAKRPTILVGNGVRLAGGTAAFHQIIDRLGMPVLATWKAMDLMPEDHPLLAGRPGAAGQRGANFTQQNSDWLLILGARLDLGQTAYTHRTFARAARKIMVDIDPSEIGKMDMPIDVRACADAKLFLEEMRRQLESFGAANWSAWLAQARQWHAAYPVVLREYWDEPKVNTYCLIDALSEEMGNDDLLIPGSSGACSELTMQSFRAKRGQRIFNSEGLGPMGFGIAAAIGGCVASGGRRTVCLDGDGGFVMNVQELEVVRRLKLPIKFFVLNNNGYVSIQNTQRAYFQGRFVASDPSSGLTLPEMGKVAAAFDLPACRIDSTAQLRQQVRQVLAGPGPVVCEVMVSPKQMTAPRATSYQKPDGSMATKPMEDLWPLLDRTEFRRNMVVPPVDE